MSKAIAILGLAAIAGAGYFIGKKILSEKPDANAVVKETYNEKLHKASMYCVGAIKTGSEKISEGINEIKSGDMVKKGEETVEDAKAKTAEFKQEISDLKDMVIDVVAENYEDESSDIEAKDFEFNEINDVIDEPEEGSEAL